LDDDKGERAAAWTAIPGKFLGPIVAYSSG
jgi:hypothetical protein